MTGPRSVIVVALLIALALWVPATFASSCNACDEFSGAQTIARMIVSFSLPFAVAAVAAGWALRKGNTRSV